jgi:hypothetical protein
MHQIQRMPEPPADVIGFLDTLPLPGTLPLPWATWTLFGLWHYSSRVQWAWQTAHDRLEVELERQASVEDPRVYADFLDPAQRGIVPGLPNWRYSLRGTGEHSCYLIHRGTGERLYFSLDCGLHHIEIHEFKRYVKTYRQPPAVIERLRRLHPSSVGMILGLRSLHEVALARLETMPTVMFTRDQLPEAAIANLLHRWENTEDRLWLAAWIGDWLAADKEARRTGRTDLIRVTSRRADLSRLQWLCVLRTWLNSSGPSISLLGALKDATADETDTLIEEALADTNKGFDALELIADDPSWCPRVFELFMQFEQPDDMIYYLPHEYAAYLGRHGYRIPEVMAWLLREKPSAYRVLLPSAWKHAPDLLHELADVALREGRQDDRLTAAALVAAIGQPWCYELSGGDWPELALECLAALEQSDSATAQEQARCWVEQQDAALNEPIDPDTDLYDYCIDGVRSRMADRITELVLSMGEPVGVWQYRGSKKTIKRPEPASIPTRLPAPKQQPTPWSWRSPRESSCRPKPLRLA